MMDINRSANTRASKFISRKRTTREIENNSKKRGVNASLFSDQLTPCGARRWMSSISPILTFQSTHPMRGETSTAARFRCKSDNFNPLTPRGVRPYSAIKHLIIRKFQSTHPVTGETKR